MLAVIGGIAVAVFEIYWLIVILAAATILSWVLSELCSGGCFRNLSSSYKEPDTFDDNINKQYENPKCEINEVSKHQNDINNTDDVY